MGSGKRFPSRVILPEPNTLGGEIRLAEQNTGRIKERQQFGFVLILHVTGTSLPRFSFIKKRQKQDNDSLFEGSRSKAGRFGRHYRGRRAEGGERLRHDAATPAPKGEKTKILFKLPFCSIRVLKGERWVTALLLLKDAAIGLGLRPSVLPSCAATASS